MNLDDLLTVRKREIETLLATPRFPIVKAVQKAPTDPGVYVIWKRNTWFPLYVGEASNLRKRLLDHLGRGRASVFRDYLGPNTKVKRKVFRKGQTEDLSRWIVTNCEAQVLPFPGDRVRLEKLVTGVLNPILQSDE